MLPRCMGPTAHLIAVHVAGGADGHNMSTLREHLVQDRAVVLAVRVLVERERHDVSQRERLSCHRMPVELLDVVDDVDNIVHGPIQRACLQVTRHGLLKWRPQGLQMWLGRDGLDDSLEPQGTTLISMLAWRPDATASLFAQGNNHLTRDVTHRIFEGQEGNGAAMKRQALELDMVRRLMPAALLAPLCRGLVATVLRFALAPHSAPRRTIAAVAALQAIAAGCIKCQMAV